MDNVKDIVFIVESKEDIINQVDNIIMNQKTNNRYEYSGNEQIEIDQMIYSLFGLDNCDVTEIESWYKRKYKILAK